MRGRQNDYRREHITAHPARDGPCVLEMQTNVTKPATE
jgi:hypothetical protein